MCIDFEGHHSGGSSFVNVKMIFVITEIVCITTGTSLALRKNRSMRVPVDSLAPRTRFGSAIRVGSGSGSDTLVEQYWPSYTIQGKRTITWAIEVRIEKFKSLTSISLMWL